MIQAGSLLIRWWEPDDAAALSDAIHVSHDHLRPWMPWFAAEPLTAAERRELIAVWQGEARSGGEEHFGIFDRGELVGAVGVHRHLEPDGAEIGYWTHVAHVRRGIARTAASAITDYAFASPRVAYTEIHHDPANHVSGRIPLRLGYTLRGTFDAPMLAPGHTGRECIWRLTRADWQQRPIRE
ncbi:GNAT family N-acetyltransferase [Hoyosella sp. YIM 151337]|uniref:GNAT family N-acetyltransferase n=1 Tax=Hoyosella sp. YIM 151337 TaxID=2992742 RepID=UPI00223684D8|nr:GNAT family protein [Hoyosella sp. YIM 151337]MCW4353054.1 GNAT family N-acetyltransferase [Hoyosella sp. YIM 151337]